ncbi:MAG: RHS repeat protein [Chitinophagaceae bacterium]|nr:RHS repeat protein [Chitinophagaceae bacterium]
MESIDRGGGKWKCEYDAFGNLIKRINSLNAVTKYEYADGFLKTIINVKGTTTQLEYDVSYNLMKVISSSGYEKQWSYDVLGNCIKSSDSLGNTRKTEFNLLLLPVTINEPDGNIYFFEFDAEGNVIRTKDRHSDTKLSYDFLNHLRSRSQAGRTMSLNYDTEGNLFKLTDEHNEVCSFETDAADRLIKETLFDGLTRKYIRDKAGKVIKIERPENKFTKYDYDEVGNIAEVNYHDGSFEKYAYAKNGFLIEALNSNSVVSFERDLFGRVIMEINEEGSINYQYDLSDNSTIITSSLGAHIITHYDDYGNAICTKANEWQTNIKYDELGLEIERDLPGKISSLWTRDKLGRPTKHSVRNKEILLHDRQYSWDINYRLQRITDGTTGITQFQHDEIGNLTKTIFSDGTEQLRNIDAVGNLFNSVSKTDSNYGKSGSLLRRNGTSYKYDDEGNLIEKEKLKVKHGNIFGTPLVS